MIETKGCAAMGEGAEGMVKGAKGYLAGFEKSGGGYVGGVVRVEVAAGRAAVGEGVGAAE